MKLLFVITLLSFNQLSIAQPSNVVKINIDRFESYTNKCQIYFSLENKSNLNFTSLWIDLSVYDKNGYLAKSGGIQEARLPPMSKARGHYVYADINCREISKLAPLKLKSRDAYGLTEINNSGLNSTTADSIKFEGSSDIPSVKMLGLN